MTAGDSLSLIIEPQYLGGTLYSNTDYDLKIILRGIAASIDLVATKNDKYWLVTMTPLQSQLLQSGLVRWVATAYSATERVTLQKGTMLVEADLTGSVSFDARSIAQKALADAENALATFSSSGGKVKKYTIGNRQMEFATIAEILESISYWKIRVANEQGRNRDKLVRFVDGI